MEITSKNWVAKVKRIFPQLYETIAVGNNIEDNLSRYKSFLVNLLYALDEAHAKNNRDFIIKAYNFAEDCYNSADESILNAISEVFYAHLTRFPNTFFGCLDFIKPEILIGSVLPGTKFEYRKNYRPFLDAVKKKYPNLYDD